MNSVLELFFSKYSKLKNWVKKLAAVALLILMVELAHYLLKKFYVEIDIIFGVFVAGYLIILSLFFLKKRSFFLIRHPIVTLLIGVFVYNYVAYPSYTYRYRMTVEVETPEGLKTGSSVIEVQTSQVSPNMSPMFNVTNIFAYGEGVIVKISESQMLLFVLEKNGSRSYAAHMFKKAFLLKRFQSHREMNWYYANLKDKKSHLKTEDFPTMFSIRINDKKIINVDMINNNDFKELLGNNIFLKKIIIETTNDLIEMNLRKLDIWNSLNAHKKLRYENF